MNGLSAALRWFLGQELLFRAAFVLFLALVTWLYLAPGDQVASLIWKDKLQHAFAFTVLTVLAALGFERGGRPYRMGAFLLLFGCALEGIQGLVPGRTSAFADVVANGVGVGLGFIAVQVVNLIPAAPSTTRGKA
jgi:VanZ family protein